MLSALTRCVSNVDDSDLAELGNDHSFSSSKNLNKDEEDEIARQIIKAFEENQGHGQREEYGEDDTMDEVEEDE
jgi:hypothetical protein